MRAHALLASLSALTLTALLAGCGSTLMTISGNDPASGPAPTVTSAAEQVNGVAPNRKQEVQFSEAMDPTTINAKTFMVKDSSGVAVSGAVTYDTSYDIASFQPNPPLQTGATYTATVTTGAASAGGAHLAAPYSYSFTTRATTDTSPIAINNVSPAAGACASTTTPIVITFDEAPDATTVSSTNIVVTGPNGAVIPVTMSINAATTQVVLMPNAPLPSGMITVTVNNVADLADVAMTSPYAWSFSTACGGGGGTGGGTSMQYIAPLSGTSGNKGGGQVTVDTAGNVTVQLNGAAANLTLTVDFCTAAISGETNSNCISVGMLSTDGSGNGNFTGKFPQPGAWVGDFQLSNGPENPNEEGFDNVYDVAYGPGFLSTLLGGKTNSGTTAPTNGTVTYSNSPAPNGSFSITLTGAAPNTGYQAVEEDLYDGSGDYVLYDSNKQGTFTTDSAGDVTFTVLPSGSGGNQFDIEQASGTGQVYAAGFVVPQ
jgi:hypothetical protein